jgi:uncharacterized protein YecT (DUF1311 family)
VKVRAAGLGVVLACLAGAASAQVSDKQIQARYTPVYTKCMASPDGQSTLGMIQCMQEETERQDARLNVAYRKAMTDLTPQEKDRLKTAQRAWITFRDADCAALWDPDNWGTLSKVTANQCTLDRTIARTIELENFPPN